MRSEGRRALVNEFQTRDAHRFIENVPARLHIGTLIAVSGDKATVELQGRIIEQAILIGTAPDIGSGVFVIYAGNNSIVLGNTEGSEVSYTNEIVFAASGNFVKADYPGLLAIKVRLVGGGGAGGGANVTGRSGGGGGGGGYAEKLILVSALLASETVTIGAGGTSVAGDTDGGAGGTTSFGSQVVATGGTGGGMGSDPHGGPPGIGTVGSFLSAGQGGMPTNIGSVGQGSGLGGGSLLGGGAEGRKPGVTAAGAAAQGYGGGGSGAYRNTAGDSAGGAGMSGVVKVELLYSSPVGSGDTAFAPGVLGYTEVTSAQTGITGADLTGASVTVTVGAGRRIRLTGHVNFRQRTAAGSVVGQFKEGATTLGRYGTLTLAIDGFGYGDGSIILTPSAGSHTYKLYLSTTGGTVDTLADSGSSQGPAYILVEDIGAV